MITLSGYELCNYLNITFLWICPKNSCTCTSSEYQATFVFPCGIGVSWTVASEHSNYTYVQLCEVIRCVYVFQYRPLWCHLSGSALEAIVPARAWQESSFHFKVCVITTSLFMIALFPELGRLQYLIAFHVTGKGREILSCMVMSSYTR